MVSRIDVIGQNGNDGLHYDGAGAASDHPSAKNGRCRPATGDALKEAANYIARARTAKQVAAHCPEHFNAQSVRGYLMDALDLIDGAMDENIERGW